MRAAQLRGSFYSRNGNHERCGSEANLMGVGFLPNIFKRGRKDGVELLPNAIQIPAVILAIHYPFKVSDRHTAGIRQNIGHHDHAAIEEHLLNALGEGALSMTNLALMLSTLSSRITFPSALGTSNSTSSANNCSLEIESAPE